MKKLLDRFIQGNANPEEVALLASHFGVENGATLQKVVVYLMDMPGEADKPLLDKVYSHLEAGDWKSRFEADTQHRKKRVSQGILAAGFLILLFLILMYFLSQDKIQYDKTWKTEAVEER